MIWPDDGTRFTPNNNVCTQEITNIIKLICTLYGMPITMPSLEKSTTIEWVNDCSRCWRMFEADKGFKNWRLTNRANSALVRSSKYTGGSTTYMKTKARLSKSFDRKATLAEMFKYTHTLKENKARFADRHAEDTADGSTASIVDPNAVWHETASASYKNCVYGMGSFFTSSLHTSMLRPSFASTTSRAVESEEGVDLRLQMQELNDYRKRRVMDTDDLRLEWREQLERL
ncbi:hypothetical protein Ahy_B09g097827 isoform A [Arachis hypogaea]|uniref:Uncharacterized protein n=1 Tax=Arachis hypogaea TaxID=3818 RepID=A0A444XPY7_ARAHY|nr:hypothetical protein Ahy_B09g097827 isoform A [Arachis hypogaea]